MSLVNTEKGILGFGVYKEIFPVVIETYNFLEKNKELIKEPSFLYSETIKNLFEVLSFLSKGYNKFHTNEKAILYSSSRDCVSNIQSNLLVLSELNSSFPKDKALYFYNQFEDKIKFYNGLIKKIEEKKK